MLLLKQLIRSLIPDQIVKSYLDRKRQKEIKRYAGDAVFCPVCMSSFKTFAPFDHNVRENARCPACGSLERHRLLWKYLSEKTNLFDSSIKKCVLHFAPEKIFYDHLIQQSHLDYVPCDISPESYAYHGTIKIKKVDINSISFEEGFFDIILCNHVLEHIPDDRQAMKELYRVLKKGGWGIFQVPLDYSLNTTYEDFSITTDQGREKAFGLKDHVRIYGQDYKNRLESVGFKVNRDDFVKRFTPGELFHFGLNPGEYIYFCCK